MQEVFKKEWLSPQFKDLDQELSTQECRNFSSISGAEVNTPETKYRSTIGPNKMDMSKLANTLHFRNRTAKFEDEQNQLYMEIKNLYEKDSSIFQLLLNQKSYLRQKLFLCTLLLSQIFIYRIKRKYHELKQQTQIYDQVLIDKMHQANQQSLKYLFSQQF
ncbi:unnamed protein product [Paramecium primaurelia]|uniref:Uncharacterized protein n=1 Tax=Paramecium primaurelia TaxID=5886 RepID=A0A8S1JVT7_PARPR|nr:unnamed protein product [Paramecium primaurelia]